MKTSEMCLFEGILEKLSKSKYIENFILKGGLLISFLIGVDMCSTMAMDTTLRGIPLNEEFITKILNEILAIEIDANIEYKLIKLLPIRQEDVITPREMKYSYDLIFVSNIVPAYLDIYKLRRLNQALLEQKS